FKFLESCFHVCLARPRISHQRRGKLQPALLHNSIGQAHNLEQTSTPKVTATRLVSCSIPYFFTPALACTAVEEALPAAPLSPGASSSQSCSCPRVAYAVLTPRSAASRVSCCPSRTVSASLYSANASSRLHSRSSTRPR